jgi:hypothetical protein
MTLATFLDQMTHLCTHVHVIRNGLNPSVEAILPISKEQITMLREGWTAQYYQEQWERTLAIQQKERARLQAMHTAAARRARAVAAGRGYA